MTTTCAEGVVLSEQSVLAFRPHPPSPFAAGQLPQCVRQQRGGQDKFAMSQQTQLQFNLQIPPNPANLATNFNPSLNPSPVVIEKVTTTPSSVHGARGTSGYTTLSADRLALAVRLARRDLLRNETRGSEIQIHQPSSHHNEEEPCTPATVDLQRKSHSDGGSSPPPLGYVHHQYTIATPTGKRSTNHHHVHEAPPIRAQSIRQTLSDLPHKVSPLENSMLNDESNQRSGHKTSQEIVRLRREIQKQVTLLKNLKEKNRRAVEFESKGRYRDNIKRLRGEGVRVWRGDSGRVWREEEEGDEEREKRRKEEQAIRTARMVYNLTQQVESLQRDLKRLELNTEPSHHHTTKKAQSQAMNRLAATHRAALRTLQNFHSSPDQPLTTELALLLQKLSLLSAQLEVEGTGAENDLTLQELQELVSERNEPDLNRQKKGDYGVEPRFSSEHTSKEKENSHPKRKVTKRIHFGSARKPPPASQVKGSSVLFDSRLQSQRKRGRSRHFAKQTLSSSKRQQPLVPYTPAMHSTPFTPGHRLQCETNNNRSKPSFRTPLHISFKQNKVPLQGGSPQSASTQGLPKKGNSPQGSPQHCPPAHTPPPPNTNSPTTHQPGEDRVNYPSRNGVLFQHDSDDGRGDQFNGLERINATLAQHNVQLEQLRVETREKLTELQERLVNTKKVAEPNIEKKKKSASIGTEGSSMEELKMLQSRSDLLSLVKRIEELEGEEEVIRQRWSTVVYQDPLVSRPATLVEDRHNNKSEGLQQPSVLPPLPPHIVPPLPPETLANVEQYRERYNHYLKLTGVTTQGGFDPWRVTESLADELLSEAVEQVAVELEQMCENCVDSLYSAEFAKPS